MTPSGRSDSGVGPAGDSVSVAAARDSQCASEDSPDLLPCRARVSKCESAS